jgi:hypothetical protein
LIGSTAIGGSAQKIALLSGVHTSLSDLLAHNDIRVGTGLY